MDGVYILQTLGKEGPEYRVSEIDDLSSLVKNKEGKAVRDMNVLKTNIKTKFSDSKVFNSGDDAVEYANCVLSSFKEKGIEFKNGVKIMPPMEFEF